MNEMPVLTLTLMLTHKCRDSVSKIKVDTSLQIICVANYKLK